MKLLSKNKKKFKDTKLAGFLRNKAPDILNIIADYVPGKPVLKLVANLLEKDSKILEKDKSQAQLMIEVELMELEVENKKYESTKAMLNSKKFRYAIGTILTMILIQFTNMEPEVAELLTYGILTIGTILIGGQAVADFGKEAKKIELKDVS